MASDRAHADRPRGLSCVDNITGTPPESPNWAIEPADLTGILLGCSSVDGDLHPRWRCRVHHGRSRVQARALPRRYRKAGSPIELEGWDTVTGERAMLGLSATTPTGVVKSPEGNSGRYFALRNSASATASSWLTRGAS
jgi:hypothetical protein